MTGRDVTVETADRITRTDRRPNNWNAETTSYDFVVRAAPVEEQPVSSTPDFGPWTDITLGWFDDVSEDAHWEHSDVVDDIRRCLGQNTQ